jgi:uncharacterized protein (TIGR03084 family)
MDDVIGALEAQQAELWSMVEGLDAEGLETPSRCEGWSVADVLLHLAQTDELAAASADGHLESAVEGSAAFAAPVTDVDEWAAAAVTLERQDPVLSRDRWKAGAEAEVAALRRGDPSRRVLWVAGELSARTLATTRLSETWIHTGDVAAGLGIAPEPTDRLWHVARLAWRTLPYAFARVGRPAPDPVAFVLTGPDGSSWAFEPDGPAATVVRGDALELCSVAGQRADAADTGLVATGPDAAAVLELVRTFA